MLQRLRVRNVLIRCTLRALGVTGGTVGRLQAEEKGRLLGANGFGTGFEDGWGIYRRKWGQGCSRKRELPKPRNEGKNPLGGLHSPTWPTGSHKWLEVADFVSRQT